MVRIGFSDDILLIRPWQMCDGHGSCILLGRTFGHRYLWRMVSSHFAKAVMELGWWFQNLVGAVGME